MSTTDSASLREALKVAASAIKAAGLPFALAGSYALWVYGAPEGEHDVDLVVAECDVEAVADCLTAAGLTVERPPEDWLFKTYVEGAMVDVLHRLSGVPVEPDLIARAVEMEVLGIRIPVLPPTEVVVAKLVALTERYCDYGSVLPAVRATREQLDWPRLRAAAVDRPFAEAFVFLCERLGIDG